MPQRSTPNKRVDYDADAKTKEGKHIDFFNGKKSIVKLGAGDSFYVRNFVKSREEKEKIFEDLLDEVEFQQMFNFLKGKVEPIPRLIAAQTEKKDPKSAIYRMPGCNESNIPTKDWTPTVQKIRDLASKEIDQELNHCVVTLYRDQEDSLAFHQDKILDLAENSLILSVSFGSPRPFILQEINGKHKQTIILQPGSLLAIGPKTNKHYRHAVPKLNEEVPPRISLSIRTISSFEEVVEEKGEAEGSKKVVVTGKGGEHQTKNYPYIKSYDDKSEYTPAIKKQIDEYVEKAMGEFSDLRKKMLKKASNQAEAEPAQEVSVSSG